MPRDILTPAKAKDDFRINILDNKSGIDMLRELASKLNKPHIKELIIDVDSSSDEGDVNQGQPLLFMAPYLHTPQLIPDMLPPAAGSAHLLASSTGETSSGHIIRRAGTGGS